MSPSQNRQIDKRLYFEPQKELIKYTFEHNGYTYEIRTNGTHPCAYIFIPDGHTLFKVDYTNIELDVHGGLTYGQVEEGFWVIGWDYAHSGDFSNFFQWRRDGYSWSMEEIQQEAKDAIEQISRLKQFQVKQYYFAEEENEWR